MPSLCLAPLSEEQVGYAKSIEGFQREIPDNGTDTKILPSVVDTSRYGGSHSGRSSYLSPLPGKRSMEGGNGLPVDYMLPDSSSITLFPHSSVRFHAKDYQSSSRRVHMEGKVAFSVKHDNARPFTVEGKLSQVRVLGTVFTVDESRADTAVVQVMSGKVQFSAIGQSDTVILTGGMTAQVTGERKDIQIIKEGKTGSFIFDNTPLPKVLEELSKFYKVKLVANKTDRRLTASFKDKSLDEIIEIIEKVLNVRIEKKKQ